MHPLSLNFPELFRPGTKPDFKAPPDTTTAPRPMKRSMLLSPHQLNAPRKGMP
jgi:hypothetical protein